MSKSRRLLSKSAACRFDWRPSRWLTAALLVLTVLAMCSVLTCELPKPLAWPLALLTSGYGRWLVYGQHRRAAHTLVIPVGSGAALCDGAHMHTLRVCWRGPLAFLDWRDGDGRRQRLLFWPDTLDAARRRELKLAMQCRETATAPVSVAG